MGCAAATLLHADPYVAIRATADTEYAARRAATDPPPEETYVFYEGQFFPGIVRDRTLEKTPFERILQTLAFDLKRQHYIPTQRREDADLIIVVHWGVTRAFERSPALAAYDPHLSLDWANAVSARSALLQEPNVDPLSSEMISLNLAINDLGDDINRQSLDLSLNQLDSDLRATSAAALLGLTEALRKENNAALPSTRLAQLKAMLQEERYFIIAIAYDWRALRRDRSLKRLWSVRLSVRAAGVNFHTAMGRLSTAAGAFFGQQADDLTIKRIREHKGEVHLGELIVVGVEEEPMPETKPKIASPPPASAAP